MRLHISQPSAVELKATLSMPWGTRFFGGVVGMIFLGVGALFLFSSLPHTDDLALERRGGNILCRKSQALAGRWELNSKTVSLGPGAQALVIGQSDEGSVTYHVALDNDGEKVHFGKSKADSAEAQALADSLNRYLGESVTPTFSVRQQTWWWFLSPFGLLGVGVGFFIMGLCNHRDVWCFNLASGQAACRRHFGPFWKARSWPLRHVNHVTVLKRLDHEGDTFYNLRLALQSGEKIELCSTSHSVSNVDALQEKADHINRFLGVTSRPLEIVDERKPRMTRAEIDAQIGSLSESHPQAARLLENLAGWPEPNPAIRK